MIGKYGAEAGLYIPGDAESLAKEDEWVCYIYGELDETTLYHTHNDISLIPPCTPQKFFLILLPSQ